MILGLALVGVLVVIALVIGSAMSRRHHRGTSPAGHVEAGAAGSGIRRFFQYLLLAGLLFASATGVTGLLGRLLDRGDVLLQDEAALALQLTLTLIALPLWVLLARWSWRRLHSAPTEARSAAWAAYLTVVGLVSLVVAMTAWHEALSTLVGSSRGDGGSALARALVWSLVWGVHHWWGPQITPRQHLRPLHLIGSLIGLGTAATGLVRLLSSALRVLLGLGGESIVDTTTPLLLDGGIVFAVGAAAWVAYWARRAAHDERDTPWLAVVLLAGVGGGLVTAVVAASLAAYSVLVWLVGDPRAASASEHFGPLPGQLAAALVGLLVWWYHRMLLDAERAPERTEVRRVYEYLLAAIGLLAAGSGIVVLVVTVVEVVAAGADVLVGSSAVNTLLGALVLLVVGLPVWWRHWSRAQRARSEQPAAEVVSPTRRAYLLLLFGVMGLTSVVTVMTLVYLVLRDALASGVGVETLRSIRFALGILVTTSILAAYHWTIFRADRDETEELERAGVLPGPARAAAQPLAPRAPRRRVLLVGGVDGAAGELGDGALDLERFRRTDVTGPAVSVEELREVLARHPSGDLLLLQEPDGLRVVPVEREH